MSREILGAILDREKTQEKEQIQEREKEREEELGRSSRWKDEEGY